MSYTYIKTIFSQSDLEQGFDKGFEKDIEFAEIVKKEDTLFLRHFVHTCSQEGNDRPYTYIRDILYPIKDADIVSFLEDNLLQEDIYEYIAYHDSEKIELWQESSDNVYPLTYRTKL